MSVRAVVARAVAVLIVLQAGALAAYAEEPDVRRSAPRWGAIASGTGGYGYSFDQKSRAAAEQVARAQCERPSGPQTAPSGRGTTPTACEVRTVFDRSCAALVTGNFGEWGTAIAGTKEAAGESAVAECNGRLPTEPCKLVVSVCSTG
ncbi:MAG: DUF4189 domain-containing protein [Janthinobacterium lividum]